MLDVVYEHTETGNILPIMSKMDFPYNFML
jgi:hypothetical protein